MKTSILLAAAGALLAASSVHVSVAAAASKPRTSQSLACSKEADAKGLHGKERKTFRSKCKKDAKGKASGVGAS